MKYLKKVLQYIVTAAFFAIFGAAHAGSYEDFFKAIQLDNAREVQRLLARGLDPNTPNAQGIPGLLLATQEQSFKVAQVLAADPQTAVDPRSARNESPLMLAALRGEQALVVQLVGRGAEVNKSGWTPLHYAATGGHAPRGGFSDWGPRRCQRRIAQRQHAADDGRHVRQCRHREIAARIRRRR